MSILRILLGSAALLSAFSPLMRASSTDLYDFAVNVTGPTSVSGDWQDLSANDPTALPGMNMGSVVCCGDASGGTTPGLGTLTYTFDPSTPGTYTVSLYFDYDAAIPDYNEYGIVNGSAPSGIGYEIFNANDSSGDIVLFGANGDAGGEVYGTPNGVNEVPGTTDNYLNTCGGPSCNADVGLALSYTFTLAAGEEEVLTALASTTNPGGFSIEDVHPVDAGNGSETDVFLTGSEATQPVGVSTVPEPASGFFLGAAMLALAGAVAVRRKLSQES
jgi:hypothetical protein